MMKRIALALAPLVACGEPGPEAICIDGLAGVDSIVQFTRIENLEDLNEFRLVKDRDEPENRMMLARFINGHREYVASLDAARADLDSIRPHCAAAGLTRSFADGLQAFTDVSRGVSDFHDDVQNTIDAYVLLDSIREKTERLKRQIADDGRRLEAARARREWAARDRERLAAERARAADEEHERLMGERGQRRGVALQHAGLIRSITGEMLGGGGDFGGFSDGFAVIWADYTWDSFLEVAEWLASAGIDTKASTATLAACQHIMENGWAGSPDTEWARDRLTMSCLGKGIRLPDWGRPPSPSPSAHHPLGTEAAGESATVRAPSLAAPMS